MNSKDGDNYDYEDEYDAGGFVEHDEPYGMTYEEEGFRAVYKEFVVFPIANQQLKELFADFPGSERADSFLGYGYIDHETGLTIEVLALTNEETSEIFDPFPDEVSVKVRIGELLDVPFVIIEDFDGQTRDEYATKLDIIDEGYKGSEELETSREYEFLDEYRDSICIDDVRVLFEKEGNKLEEIWVRIEGLKGSDIVGTILVEPYQDYGVHLGDEITFNMRVKNGKKRCVCVLK